MAKINNMSSEVFLSYTDPIMVKKMPTVLHVKKTD